MHLHIMPDASAMRQTAVEVKIWEGYLLRNRTNISTTLCAYSLDDGPWHETDDGRFIFRFTSFDWFNTIQQLLTRENIHCDPVCYFEMESVSYTRVRKISLITAEADLAESITTALEAAGYVVNTFSSARPVLESFVNPVDLFIIDRQLPDFDALNICRHLRVHPSTKDVPAVLLSGDATKCEEALLAGATEFIVKPFHIHYLLNVVTRHTHSQRER